MVNHALNVSYPALIADANHQIDTAERVAGIVNDIVSDDLTVWNDHFFAVGGEQGGGENMYLFHRSGDCPNLYHFSGAEWTQETNSTPAAKLESDPCSASPMANPAAPMTAIMEDVSIPTRPNAATTAKARVM